jgi:hypothetical protein
MHKVAQLNSSRWIELAVLAPGQSHYWSFDPSWDAHEWVFQATAHPEPPDDGLGGTLAPSRVEVTELFVLRAGDAEGERKRVSRVNITVTNCGELWAAYSLWVVAVPPRKIRRQARRHDRVPAHR